MRSSSWLMALLLTTSADAVRSQDVDTPPVTRPADASFGGATVSLPGAQLTFSGATISLSTAAITLPGATVTLPSAVISSPAGAVTSPSAGMTIREEKGGLRFTLNADLLFDFDKADLRRESDGVLRQLIAEVDKRMAGGRFRIEGHTDGKGTDRYNDSLSPRRAKSVQAWLTVRGGVVTTRITTSGLGKKRPVAPNQRPDGSDDPEGRKKNRRVEILVMPRS